jgi:hypothetical protein
MDNNTLNPMEQNETAQEEPVLVKQGKKRGRPKMSVNWPDNDFTFDSLTSMNSSLSSSSLRKKMRVELVKGGLVKTGTLKTSFGRPKSVYKKAGQ